MRALVLLSLLLIGLVAACAIAIGDHSSARVNVDDTAVAPLPAASAPKKYLP